MKKPLLHALIIAALSSPAFAMDTPKPDPKDPEKKDAIAQPLDQARAAIARQDWTRAQAFARQAVARDPLNADAHNLYAYAMRKGPNPAMDLVFRHYNEALRLNPQHRGAHEYIGEAYLMVNNLPKAEEHLAQLNKLCFLPCAEYTELKKAVEKYKTAAK